MESIHCNINCYSFSMGFADSALNQQHVREVFLPTFWPVKIHLYYITQNALHVYKTGTLIQTY